MLQTLTIQNYVLIDSLSLKFGSGLNIITGDTGAGKSIILGALGLILGNRADTKVLYNPSIKCVIEGRLDIRSYALKEFFDSNDFDYDDEVVIRREINPSGKSRAFINDTPARLQQLNSLSIRLIDLHQQFDTLELRDSKYQQHLIDIIAGNQKFLLQYSEKYTNYKNDLKRLSQLFQRDSEGKKELDYMLFQLNELDEINLMPDELNNLEYTIRKLENQEEIQSIIAQGSHLLDDSERGLISQLQSFIRSGHKLIQLDPRFEKEIIRLESVNEELIDIHAEFVDGMQSIDQSDDDLQEMISRLDTLNRILTKHQVTSVEELMHVQKELEEKINQYKHLEQEIAVLEQNIQIQQNALWTQAEQLHDRRLKCIPVLESHVINMLKSLAMPNARIDVQLSKTEALGPDGFNKTEFLFAANKGGEIQSLRKVASGGEISRLNLSLKTLIANKVSLPTLIFDEIDSGISGEVALQMGSILKQLAEKHQIISITHSPQVAAKADYHFYVYKFDKDQITHTQIKQLDDKERVIEVAKMLSGDPPIPSAIENAKELIKS